jgi:hypothetical protein
MKWETEQKWIGDLGSYASLTFTKGEGEGRKIRQEELRIIGSLENSQ